jgi:hypothetical protein
VTPLTVAPDLGPFDPMEALGLVALDEADEFTNALLFGDAGTGKTSCMAFLANLPGDGLTVIINAEGGLKKQALKTLGVDTSKVVIWPDRSKGEEISYDSLETLLYRLRNALQRQPGSIKGVGFDSATDLIAGLLQDITFYAYEKDQSLPQVLKDKRAADGKKLRESPHETQLQDYGLLTNQARTLFRGFRDLGCHFVITALEKDDAVSDTGTKAIGPELPNKISNSLRSYVDLVLRLTAETLKIGATEQATLVTAETKASLTRQCKDREGVLPFKLVNPTFDRIHQYVKGDLTEATDPEISRYTEIRATADKVRAARKQRPAA